MNIYALKGHQVVVTEASIKNGNDTYREIAEKHLTIGNIYTVNSTNVHNSYTTVSLVEYPHVLFNSVSFEDLVVPS